MPKQHGPWQITSSSQAFTNQFMTVNNDAVIQPDGKPGSYATVRLQRGVVVVPIDNEGNVYLVKQFRYALGKERLEAVSGGMEEAEQASSAARRELEEELGITAASWQELGVVDLDTSIVNCSVQLFLARDLTFRETQREGSEVMRTVKLPFDEAVQLVHSSTITHAASCTLLLKAQPFLQGR